MVVVGEARQDDAERMTSEGLHRTSTGKKDGLLDDSVLDRSESGPRAKARRRMVGRGAGKCGPAIAPFPNGPHFGLGPQEVMPRIRNAMLPRLHLLVHRGEEDEEEDKHQDKEKNAPLIQTCNILRIVITRQFDHSER